MKRTYTTAIVLFLAINAMAQSVPANFAPVLAKFKQFYNSNKPDSIYAMFAPEMKTAMPLDKWNSTTIQLKSQLGNLGATEIDRYVAPTAIYKASFANAVFFLNLSLNSQNKLIGVFFTPYQEPSKTIQLDASLTEEPVLLKMFTGTIPGSLTIPKDVKGKMPVVLIIPGSGPTDRDGNSPKLGLTGNTYKMLANELGKNGIAVLRYDKRLVGQSVTSTKEKELRFTDYVDDAVGLVNMLHDDSRFSKVIVLGHSEGSLVGLLTLRDQPVKGFISVAGAGRTAEKIVQEQVEKSMPKFLVDQYKTVVDSMRKGKTTDYIDPQMYSIIRPSIQPYLMSWFRYDPIRMMKMVKVPALILQGTTDIQVTVEDAEKLKKADSDAKLVIIPGMNHILKEAPADREQNIATYTKPTLPIKPELVAAIVEFVNGVK
nr:alpha/beta fold hydrolase [uncultured Mucilaginibacter sp.]